MDKIAQAITRLFDKNRIVFWYDAKKELRQEYDARLAARSGKDRAEK